LNEILKLVEPEKIYKRTLKDKMLKIEQKISRPSTRQNNYNSNQRQNSYSQQRNNFNNNFNLRREHQLQPFDEPLYL
jgi:hypothetical protein